MKLYSFYQCCWSGFVDQVGLGYSVADGPFCDYFLSAPAEWAPISVEESPLEFEGFYVEVPRDGGDD